MIKHIWWDLDGTLYKMPHEYEELKYKRRFELFSEITGKPIDEELKKRYHELYEECGTHSAVFVKLGKPKDFWQLEHQKIDYIPYLSPDPRTVEMFRVFKTKPYLHSIFTNRKHDYIQKILAHLEIDYNLFANILTNDDLTHPKPHPEGFRRLVEISDIPAKEILYVGDRIKADIIPAKKVGMITALVWSNKKKTDADYTLPHVADVISILR